MPVGPIKSRRYCTVRAAAKAQPFDVTALLDARALRRQRVCPESGVIELADRIVFHERELPVFQLTPDDSARNLSNLLPRFVIDSSDKRTDVTQRIDRLALHVRDLSAGGPDQHDTGCKIERLGRLL